MMWKRKRPAPPPGAVRGEPAVRASICTGERVAGWIDRDTGRFVEVQLIRSDADLEEFCRTYGIQGPIRTIY